MRSVAAGQSQGIAHQPPILFFGFAGPAAMLQTSAQGAATGPTRQQRPQPVKMSRVQKPVAIQQIGQSGRQRAARRRQQRSTNGQLGKEIGQRQRQFARQELIDQGSVIREFTVGARRTGLDNGLEQMVQQLPPHRAGSTAASFGNERHQPKADRAYSSPNWPPAVSSSHWCRACQQHQRWGRHSCSVQGRQECLPHPSGSTGRFRVRRVSSPGLPASPLAACRIGFPNRPRCRLAPDRGQRLIAKHVGVSDAHFVSASINECIPAALRRVIPTADARCPAAGPWRRACGCSRPPPASRHKPCAGSPRWP